MSSPGPEASPAQPSSKKSAEPAIREPSWLGRALRTVFRFQTSRPGSLLLVALLSVLLAGFLASKLKLKTSFGELLPQNKESVIVAEQVNERLVAASTLTLVAEGQDPKGLKGFIDALAPQIRALGSDYVGNVDDGVRASQEFFKAHQLLYAPLEEVRKVHDEIVDRYDYEIGKELGTTLDDANPPPPITAENIRARMKKGEADAKAAGPVFPDGYYMEPDQHMIALLIRTPVSSGDSDRSKALFAKIEEVSSASHRSASTPRSALVTPAISSPAKKSTTRSNTISPTSGSPAWR